jgi:hypothetical protein
MELDCFLFTHKQCEWSCKKLVQMAGRESKSKVAKESKKAKPQGLVLRLVAQYDDICAIHSYSEGGDSRNANGDGNYYDPDKMKSVKQKHGIAVTGGPSWSAALGRIIKELTPHSAKVQKMVLVVYFVPLCISLFWQLKEKTLKCRHLDELVHALRLP